MKNSSLPNLNIALVHYPVTNKNGDVVASAVTSLDLHDLSRAAMTYGVHRFFVVTPLEDQHQLVARIVRHWVQGNGARYNPKRKEAFGLMRVAESLEAVIQAIAAEQSEPPRTVVTCARRQGESVSFRHLRRQLADGRPTLLMFGTGWGLAPEVFTAADVVLEPICGPVAYNHLSVRAAAAIVLDRLVG